MPQRFTPRTRVCALLLAVAACGERPDYLRRPVIACSAPGDEVISMAVAAYLEQVTPRPKRFLIAVGTDSVLPDAGRAALQDKGPTFLYPSDPAQQAAMRSQLAAKGAYPTLLVVYRGMRRLDDARAMVRVGGHFVGGAEDGRAAPSRAIYFQCDTARWHVSHAEEERLS
jgi:hypothetical protein